MRVVVTGGAGDLGARVVRELAGRGHEAVPASRRTGVDLATGARLDAALDGAYAVVHCATDPRHAQAVDVDGARRIAESVARLGGSTHLVAVSIVGCDLVPYAYYRAKRDTERVLEESGRPATVLRATQFHSLAAFLATTLRVGRAAFTIGDMAIQPVDVDWVATRLADLAESPAPEGYRRATDVAGPQPFTMRQLGRLVARHDGRPAPAVLRIPPVGGVLRAFSQRANLPGDEVETGGRPFQEWLAGRPSPLPRAFHDQA